MEFKYPHLISAINTGNFQELEENRSPIDMFEQVIRYNTIISPDHNPSLYGNMIEVIKLLLKCDLEGMMMVLLTNYKSHQIEFVRSVAELLLIEGADPNIYDLRNKCTPFGYASCIILDPELFHLFIEYDADIDDICYDGSTCLTYLTCGGMRYPDYSKRLEMITLLLEYGADPNKADRRDHRPIENAVAFRNLDQLSMLLDYGANSNTTNYKGDNLLFDNPSGPGSIHSLLSIFQILLENGTDPNHFNKVGQLPLHTHFKRGRVPLVKLLLKFGADPLLQDSRGFNSFKALKACSSLHRNQIKEFTEAIRKYRRSLKEIVVFVLLENGADMRLIPNGFATI